MLVNRISRLFVHIEYNFDLRLAFGQGHHRPLVLFASDGISFNVPKFRGIVRQVLGTLVNTLPQLASLPAALDIAIRVPLTSHRQGTDIEAELATFKHPVKSSQVTTNWALSAPNNGIRRPPLGNFVVDISEFSQ